MNKSPDLPTVIAELIARQDLQNQIALKRGLVLTYLPPQGGSRLFTLAARRLDVPPSDQELKIVQRSLVAALRDLGRPFDHLLIRHQEQAGRKHWTRITWTQPEQLGLAL